MKAQGVRPERELTAPAQLRDASPPVAPEPQAEVLIVDDEDQLRHSTERILQEGGYACEGAGNAAEARACLERGAPSLVLLDLNMPGESGMELLSHIRSCYPATAVVMVTGADDPRLAMRTIEHGAYGYMVKPVRSSELLINVANALHRRRHEAESQLAMQTLKDAADDHGRQLEDALQGLRLSESQVSLSQAETILRLARLVEFRDEETGHHLHRMSAYCEILARQIGLPERDREMVRMSSQLHDVGKVVIPDRILHKRGRLTPEEHEVIKTHAETGYQMLWDTTSEIVQMSAVIARTHHERWDGSGYPRGLSGTAIPLPGRIAAVADVFDALTSDRIYRPAFPIPFALQIMKDGRGTHFDPELLDAFMVSLPEVEATRRAYRD